MNNEQKIFERLKIIVWSMVIVVCIAWAGFMACAILRLADQW